MVIIFLMAYIELYLWSGCSKFQAKHTPIINNSISRAPTEQETKKEKQTRQIARFIWARKMRKKSTRHFQVNLSSEFRQVHDIICYTANE